LRRIRISEAAALACAPLLAGCVAPDAGCSVVRQPAIRAEITAADRWSHQPTALGAFGRSGPLAAEQIYVLENGTVFPGDNTLRMLARTTAAGHAPPFSPAEIFACSGGAPEPFSAQTLDGMIVGEDAAGPVMWTQTRVGVDTICALGLRRLTADRNLTPDGASVVDVVLRNCVAGPIEEAMAPLRPDRIAVGPGTRPAAGASSSPKLLSPLAGPRPSERTLSEAAGELAP
jgi:hypothetical protein